MKCKILLFSLLLFVSNICNAQIFNKIRYVDKFDDETKTEVTLKSLVSITDTTITVEEKGKASRTYWIIPKSIITTGTKNNPVNLLSNVWGYQKEYLVLKNKHNSNSDNVFIITHRTITEEFTKEYITEFFWITDHNGNRIIYMKN